MICIIMCSACKTRKVQTDITKNTKSSNTEQTSYIQASDSSKTIDKSTEQTNSLKTAENTSTETTEFQADSIVQKGDRTIIYPKGPVKTIITKTGTKKSSQQTTKQNNIENTNAKSLDSSGTFKQEIKQDSSRKTKVIDAKGNGTTWATWVPIMIGLVLAFGLFLAYRYFKK
jgi:hypothetical protein